MKKRLAYFAMLLTLGSSFLAVPVRAMSETETDTTPTSSETEDSTSAKAAREVRLGDYKKLLKDTMTTALKARIAERCVAAQAIVKIKTTNNGKVTTVRTAAYDEIVTDLEAVSTAAAAKGADVTALNASIALLKTKVTTFKTANTAYQQALSDLAALDCKTDPTAFKAALEVARSDQLAVFNAAKDIRTHLTTIIKPALQVVKTSLETLNK